MAYSRPEPRNDYRRLARPLAVCLILLPLLAGAFFPVGYFAMQSAVRARQFDLIRRLPSEDSRLHRFSFRPDDHSDLHFLKKNEFLYEGIRYDIHTIVRSGDRYVIYALPDLEETALLELLTGAKEQTANYMAVTGLLFFPIYFFQPVPAYPAPEVAHVKFLFRRTQPVQTVSPERVSPPPEGRS